MRNDANLLKRFFPDMDASSWLSGAERLRFGRSSNALLVLAFVPALVACATTTTSDVGQVREVAPGTYKIGVARGASSVVFGGTEATNAAVDRAGQYCRAKGQKIVIVPTQDRDVTFRCGEKIMPGE